MTSVSNSERSSPSSTDDDSTASSFSHLVFSPPERLLHIRRAELDLHRLLPFAGRVELTNHRIYPPERLLIRSFAFLAHAADERPRNGFLFVRAEVFDDPFS